MWQFEINLSQKEKTDSYIATPGNNDIILLYENTKIASHVRWVGFLKTTFFPGYFTESNLLVFCLGDVPATNIFNYDRMNLQDDPGCSWVFVRKRKKESGKCKIYKQNVNFSHVVW